MIYGTFHLFPPELKWNASICLSGTDSTLSAKQGEQKETIPQYCAEI